MMMMTRWRMRTKRKEDGMGTLALSAGDGTPIGLGDE